MLAPAAILLVACQSTGDISLQTFAGQSPIAAVGPSAPRDSVLNIVQMPNSDQVGLQFSPGTSDSSARLIGQGYGLELIDGSLFSGPWRSGFYIFQIPKVSVQATTPTTANVYFPSYSTLADRKAYLDQNHLTLIRWVRSEVGMVAFVRLPPANLHVETLDPVQGLFRIALPAGLNQQAVDDWAQTVGLRLVGYDSGSGLTVVHPEAWTLPAPGPVAFYSPPQPQPVQTPRALASPDRLFVQFATSLSIDDVTAAAQKIGLTVVSVTATNLATLSGDPSKIKAAIQLLSDLATVQCVSASPNPCTPATAAAPANTNAPAPQFGQPSTLTLQVKDGILQLDWPVAAGATAYAIFRASASSGPYQMIAIVAGQTSYLASQVIASGATEYFQVMALHPCTVPIDSSACDVAAVTVSGAGTASVMWTNPFPQPLTATQSATVPTAPAPSPATTVQAPQPTPPAQAPAAPSPEAPSPATTAATPQPTPSAQAPAAPSPQAPSPATTAATPQPTPAAQAPAAPSPAAPSPSTSASAPQPTQAPQPTPPAQAPAAPSPQAPSPATTAATPQPTPVAQPPTASATQALPSPSAQPPAPVQAAASPPAPQPTVQTGVGPAPLAAPVGVSAAAGNGHVTVSWQPVTGAASYRLYRSAAGGAASYVATTSESMFVDTGGSAGGTYSYQVAAVAGSGLVGILSGQESTTWQNATSTPSIVRSLPAQAGALAGRVRLQIDATSGDGRGSVEWRVSGPAAALTVGTAPGQPSAQAALSWSAALTWDTNSVPDGTYTIIATVSDASGNTATSSSKYRIQNGAPAAPTNLSAVYQPTGIALTWQQPASDTAAFYRLFRDQPSSSAPLVELSADRRSFVDTGAQLGQHRYVLLLVDSAGHASSPVSVDVSVGAPINQQADGELDLQVLLPTGQPLAADGLVTDRLMLITPSVTGLSFQLSSDGQTWTTLAQEPTCAEVCTSELTLDSVAAGPHSVRALTSSRVSAAHSFVRADAVRYQPPTGLTAVHNVLGVDLTWSAPPATLPASYLVSRRVAGGDWQLLDSVAASEYIDAAAPSGVMVRYRVSAIDPEGTSGIPSGEATIEVPVTELAEQKLQGAPPTPARVEAFAGNGRATVRWDSVSGANGFLIERQLQPNGPFAVVGMTGDNSFADTTALAVGQVTYRVLALNGVIEGSPSAVARTLVIPNTQPTPLLSSATDGGASPSAPLAPKASAQGDSVQLSWTAPDGASLTTYSVYRLDPSTGVFSLAASRLETTSFVDASLSPGAGYGYVVTTTAPGGLESSFSEPVWATFPADSSVLSVDLVAPGPADAVAPSQSLQALAKVTAAAGLSGISFEIAPAGGPWTQLPTGPIDPRAPLPMPAIGMAGPGLWGSTVNTSTLTPGTYKLRVRVTDRAGRAQERIQELVVPAPDARGPPSPGLTATGIPGGVHLTWSQAAASYAVERSIFGDDGPFETIASTQAQEYDDHSAIAGQSYTYRLRPVVGTQANNNSVSASALVWQSDSTGGAPSIQLGAISLSELGVTISTSAATKPLTSGLRQLGDAYDVTATSLASGQQVHRLGEPAQINFSLPPGLSGDDAASAAIYHWDDTTGSWIREESSLDSNATELSATINHLSQFVLASVPAPAGGGSLAQPPAPPTDPAGLQSSSSSLRLPSGPPPAQVAADGEVLSLRTANSRVYKKSDGSYQQVISTGLINYQDASGTWQKIDGNLVQNGAGSSGVHNAANSFRVDLPGTISERAISVTDGSAVIAMSLVGATAVPVVSNSNHASYAAALPGVDANYDVIPNGLKESLVINSRSTQSPVFAFDLSTGNLVLHQQPDGTVLAFDSMGQVKFTVNAPWMYDAAVAHSDEGTMSRQVAVTLTGGSGSYRLTYTPDAAWLNDPGRRYPVTLDPSLTVYAGNGSEYDDQINTYSPDFNYHGYTYLPIGYTYYSSPCCGSAASRAEVQFSNFLGDGYYASSATFYMYQYTNYGTQRGNCCTLFYLTAPTRGWSYTGVTWNNQPGVTGAYASAYALANGGWVAWDATSLVRAWETHALANNGVMVYANAENGPYNNNEFFYGGNSGSGPELTINYNTYSYTSAVALPTNNVIPNGGSTPVEVALSNVGTATWGTDTRLSYRWWSGGVAVTSYIANIYVPYSVPSGGSTVLQFNLVAPSLATTGPVYLQLALRNNTFWFSSLAWSSPSYSCDQFYYSTLSCTTGTAITLANESGTIAWQRAPQVISAVASSLLTIPLTLTNTSNPTGSNYTWHAYNAADMIRVGIRDYRSVAGAITMLPPPNLRTYLPGDVGPQTSTSLNAVLQAPGDPGDYLLRLDLVHETPSSTVWFADQGNQPLEILARILAPGDDKTTQVPMALGDGSSLGVNTSNGFATLSATDISIAERAGANLQVMRTYNGVNSLLSIASTSATSSTYGLGWTFNFQRSLHLGSLGPNTYDPTSGILTDAQGRAWTLSWNGARGLFEDAAGNRTVTPTNAQVVTATGSVTVPGVRPVDLLNGSGAVVADVSAPGGYALRLEGTNVPPTALVMPAGSVPVQQNGSIEFWFRPNFDMSVDTSCHVFFNDAQMRFGLAWNCTSQPWGSTLARSMDFFTYDADSSTYDILASAAVTWASGSWHHISITWAEGGAKQLMTDTSTPYTVASHSQSPVGDLIFGYQANGIGTGLGFLNGRIAQLRADGRVVPQAELNNDAASGATLNATANTLYLGHYDQGSVQSSAGGYVLLNSDQSTETYSPTGVLQNQADRYGNQIDFSWDASGRIQAISDHGISGRAISFTYNGSSFTATDLGGRTVTYQLSASGDLISVTRSDQVPDPRTGVITTQNPSTSYSYASGHLLRQVTDPMGAKTTLNYDGSSYRQVVLIDNPTAYWRLGEIGGTTAADSAGTFSGSLHGGITLGQGGGIWNDSDPAYKFDGSSGYVQVPYASALNPASAFTLEAWVRVTGAQGTWRTIVSTVFPGAGGYTGFEIGASAANVWKAQVGTGSMSWASVGGSAVVLNQWTYIAATYGSGVLSLYVNGNLQGTISTAYGANTTRELDLGADYFSGALAGFFSGSLDEVAVYPLTVSGARIQAHFAAGKLGVTANASGYAANVAYDSPIGYWRLGESTGPRAFDQSGRGNNGTYSGGISLLQSGALTTDSDTAASFDGTSGYVSVGPVGSLSRWTLEAWINPSGSQSLDAAVISDVYSTLVNYVLFFNPTGTTPLGLTAGFYDGAGWHYTTPVNVTQGSWSHVAVTYDGALIRLYIDGLLASSLSYAASPSSNGIGLRIGRRWDLANDFAGGIDEPAIYPAALSSARIMAHYLVGRAAPLGASPYPAAITSDKPTGYWRLGETSGPSAVDSTGSGYTGTYIGGFTLGQSGAIANDADYAASFNGSSGYVSLGNPVAFQTTAGTVEAWINTTTTSQSAIASKLYAWWFGVQPTGKLGFYDMTAHTMRDSGVTVNDGRWHQVAAVFQSGVAAGSQMYVDGRAAGSPFLMTVSNQTVEVEIAGYSTTTQFLNGAVDEVAIYPGALSAARILSHYQASRLSPIQATGWTQAGYVGSVGADNPVGYWRLGETSGTTAIDHSGLNNAGTYTGGFSLGVGGALATDSDTAANFDGSTGYVSIPDNPALFGTGQLSVEAWVKATTWVAAASIVNRRTTANLGGYSLQVANSSGQINFYVNIGSTWYVVTTPAGLTSGGWHHLVGTYDGANLRIYSDGNLAATTPVAGSINNPSGPLVLIGKTANVAIFFNGSIDEVAVYATALTAARIIAHYIAAWDPSQQRVVSVQDARGTTVATYNNDTATTQIFDGRGLPSYYTYQSSGGRTIANVDTGNNLTNYLYDAAAPYRQIATNSPTIKHFSLMNTSAPVGQQGQVLIEDDAGQPQPTSAYLMKGGYPDPSLYGSSTLYTTSESWNWDSTVTVQPGVASHRSTPVGGTHQHYLTFSNPVLIPAGSAITQWVYIGPGVQAPDELELQFQAADSSGWVHRAAWGPFGLFGAFGCPANCQQSSSLPVAGHWAQLTVNLGPTEGASPRSDVDMAGRLMNGIAFTLYGGSAVVWWGPTMFTLPGGSVTDPTRAITSYAYNATNDLVASVDPNGIATIKDVSAGGLTLASFTGVEPAAPNGLFQDNVQVIGTSAWQQEFGYPGTSAAAMTSPQHNGVGSLTQTHAGAGLQSDLYKDVTGLTPGTYVRVSVWVQTSVGATGIGGASLMVENHLSGPLNIQRRSASVQTAGQWMQLTMPFVVDGSGQVRVHLWQENLQGTTTWADMHIDDLTPAPDVTLQHPLGVFASSFEVQPDATWTLGTAAALNDPTRAHTGFYSIKDTLAANNTSNMVSRTLTLSPSVTYRVSGWARTAVSGSHGGSGGAQLCAQFSGSNCSSAIATEGQWQQVQVSITGSGTLTIQLVHQNFQGDVYWDDINVERVADATPASSGAWRGTGWTGTVTGTAAATWASSWSGGLGGGPSRQVTITSPGGTTDVVDILATTVLRTNASYVVSLWASSTAANSTIVISVAGQTMDFGTACTVQATPTLCQNSFTYLGGDRASNNLIIDYGGQGARTVTITHPLISLAGQLFDYTAYGQVSRVHDIFGYATTTSFDSNSLYRIQTAVTATPSPDLTTNLTYNSLGQLILNARVNGGQSIAEQIWLDSWGRKVGDVRNCVTAIAPPGLCNASPDPATNVMTRYAYDLNGNVIDTYTQGAQPGTWVDTHYLYDADNNLVARIQNCVTVASLCDGVSNGTQNVVTAYAFDTLNNLTDTYMPMPGCTANCVPLPTCTAGPPPNCTSPATPCPTSTCVDSHTVYDSAGRVAKQIANYGGSQDVSQANVTTTYSYDADGRLTDTYRPITSAAPQTGQIDEHRIYDALGRIVTDIKAYSIPSWMTATTQARTDYTLDLGGRVVSVTGPGTGSAAATNRIVTTTDYDDLSRPLSVTADSGTGHLNAVSRTVYDPRGTVHTWTPTTQQLSAGLETSSTYDLAGHLISTVKDDGSGGLHLITSTTYDGYGRATDVIDPRGIDTNTSYDALNRTSSVTQNYCPSGNSNPNCSGSGILPDQNLTTSYVYDLAGNRIETINPRSIINYTAYDALGRTLMVTNNCQTVPAPPATSCGTESSDQNVNSSQSYDQLGNVLTSTDPLNRLNVYIYDALGRKVSETINCTGYSNGTCSGSPTTSDQNLTTNWQVDAQGDVLLKRSPRQCTSLAPCYQGATGTSLTDGGNLAAAYTYDGLLRLASVIEDKATGHLNLGTIYTYDPSGNKLTQVDPRTYTTTYTVDNLGRVTNVTDANSNAVQTNYSLAGEVISTIDARGQTNTNTLDRLGRLTGVGYYMADQVTQLTQSFGYDADGNRTSFSDTNIAQTTVAYDHLNRVSTLSGPSPACPTNTSYTTTYTYFLDGAVNTVCDATGTTTFSEDHLGRIATMVDPLTTGTTTYSFDAASRLTGRTEANGIVTTVGFTGMDQLASKTEVTSPSNGSITLVSWTGVTYDLAQNRTGETLVYYAGNPYPDAHAGTAIYQYDSVNQLSQASIPGASAATYGFDAADNLTANAGTTQAYNNNESLQAVGAATVGSDKDGNQQMDVNGNALSWNSLSQLEKFSTTETYAYDALGRLTTVSNGGSVTTKFVYQGLSGQVVEELNGAGGVIRSYAWDTLGRQLYTEAGSNVYYEITDPHGDVAALASAIALVGTAHFDGWGNAFTPNGTTVPYGFQGAPGSWTDATTGFVSMGLRWYYPKVGRFLSSDPAAGTADPRTPIDGHRWLYASNSPLDNIDPTGLGCAWYDVGCGVENAISSAFNSASSAAIAADKAINAGVNLADAALIAELKSTLGSDATDKGKHDLLSNVQRTLRHKVSEVAKAGAVITDQIRPAAVAITKSTSQAVADAVNSCQHARQSVGNAVGCAVAGVTVASMLVMPEGGAAVDLVAQGTERLAPVTVDLVTQAAERLAPKAVDLVTQGTERLATEAESGGYAGVRALSRQLQDMGASRAERLQIIQSFEVSTIARRVAGASDYGLRFFGGRSEALSRYLSPTFPGEDARALSALPPWNNMSQIAQFQIREGATFYSGRVATAFEQPGGAIQYFVPFLKDLSRV